jgi:hypothetical protein
LKEEAEMSEAVVASGGKSGGSTLLTSVFGLTTSILTGLILWFVEQKFGFAFYSWTFWFVIPVGAGIAGFAAASGYYLGAWLFGHRPSRLLLVNILIASVATFFFIHYLSYSTMQIEGKKVSDYISFWEYLNIAIRSASMSLRFHARDIGSTGELGAFGYAVAALQILGFAAGGFCVYAYLTTKPFCDKCSRYLSAKGKQIRYSTDSEKLQQAIPHVLGLIAKEDLSTAIEHHRSSPDFGSSSSPKGCRLRTLIELRSCKECGLHWLKFTTEQLSDNEWKEISDLSVGGFTNQIVNVEPKANAGITVR